MAPPCGNDAKARVLVLHTPDAPELEVLKKIPEGAHIVGVGRALKDLEGQSPHNNVCSPGWHLLDH